MKKVMIIVVILIMTIFLLIYPESCLESAKYGLNLWFSVVLPSLLPFMVASFILLQTGVVRLISHVFTPVTRLLFGAPGESAYVFIASAFSGYPVGAKLTSELYASKQISESDAQCIIRFTSVSGPVFITGAVSVGMLGLAEAGIYLAATHYLSAILVGIIFGFFRKRNPKPSPVRFKDALLLFKTDIAQCKPFGELLATSIEKALKTLIKIGGFIVFFSVVVKMLSVSGIMDILALVYSPLANLSGLSADSTRALLYGGIEMTTGCNQTAILSENIVQKLSVMASIIAFGGFCIHMQTKAVCVNSRLVPKRFLLAKSLQAFLAYLLCTLSLTIFPITVAATSIQTSTKTAAYYGVIFAAVSFIILVIIKYVQKNTNAKSVLPFARKL